MPLSIVIHHFGVFSYFCTRLLENAFTCIWNIFGSMKFRNCFSHLKPFHFYNSCFILRFLPLYVLSISFGAFNICIGLFLSLMAVWVCMCLLQQDEGIIFPYFTDSCTSTCVCSLGGIFTDRTTMMMMMVVFPVC